MLSWKEKLLGYFNISPKWLFDRIPFWFPSLSQVLTHSLTYRRPFHSLSLSYSQLRDNIEFKIIEKHFLSQHPVPIEFDFAKYVSLLFRHYIAELGEVSPVSWMVLALLVVLLLTHSLTQFVLLTHALAHSLTGNEFS